MIRPPALHPGSHLAAISLSWGGPGAVPHRYDAGVRQLEQTFDVTVTPTQHALKDPEWLSRNPESRAHDLMPAFLDPDIDGIVSTIGGDDSIRLLPYLDLDIIAANPKVFIGYSDTTVSHLACYKAGLTSFYGPAIMAGFAENGGMFPYTIESVRSTLFSAQEQGAIPENRDGWTVERLEWNDPANQERPRKTSTPDGWRYLQGSGTSEGHLLGGCLDVLKWLIGTSVWPDNHAWQGAILFIETSEDCPPPREVIAFLRKLAAMGILKALNGVWFGPPGGHLLDPDQFVDYDNAILQVVAEEEGLTDLPIVTRMDFGHTDPMFVIPYGVRARIDSDNRTVSLLEPTVS